MGNNDLIKQAQKAAKVSALFRSGQSLLWPAEDKGRTSEQRLDFRGDKLYVYTPLGEGIYKEGLVMTKEIFQECYKKWIESEGKDKMTRLKENRSAINEVAKGLESKPFGTCEEMMTFHLGTIATVLCDISKSLAILADKVERECKND